MSLVVMEEFVDYDFRKDPKFIPGEIRPSPEAMQEYFNAHAAYEDKVTPLPTNRWEEIAAYHQANKTGLEWLIYTVLNQGREGSCVGNAETQAIMAHLAKAFGDKWLIPLSAISAYKLIGSSPMSGAMVSDALEAGRQVGVLPLNTPENIKLFGEDGCMPATGFYTKFPAKHREVAANFRIDEYNIIRTFEGLVTALLRGEPVVVGRAGHSILYLGVVFLNNAMYFLYVNSWGKWGMGAGNFAYGFGLDSEKYGRNSARWAFAVRSIVTPTWALAA